MHVTIAGGAQGYLTERGGRCAAGRSTISRAVRPGDDLISLPRALAYSLDRSRACAR